MKKINFKKLIPLIGIGIVGFSGVIAATSLSLSTKTLDSSFSINNKLFNYSMNNLNDYYILNNSNELANYMYNYGVFGNNKTNPIQSIDIISKTPNSDNCYNVDIRVNSNNGEKYVIRNIKTSVPVANEISNLNLENLNKYFLSFNQIINVYNSLYSNSNSLINIITSYTNLTSNQIARTSINFSNNFNYGNTNTLTFELRIFLNSNYIYNNSNVITCILPTSIIIDWNSASVNATKFFNFDDNGSIIGITDLGLQNDVLIIPEYYTNDNGDILEVNSIISLLPNNSSNLSRIKAIVLPNKIKVLGQNAFGNSVSNLAYSSLKWINLPKSLSSIGDYAFANCTNLQNLSFYNQQFLVSIGQHAFDNCTSFTDIYLNDRVLNIGNYAFNNCTNLINIKLSNSLNSISDFLFYNCNSIRSLVLPSSISYIGVQAFRNCTNLAYINMPYNLEIIGKLAFQDAISLSNIVFLDNGIVNQIQFGDSLFYKNSSNTNVISIYILGNYDNRNNFNGTFKVSNVNYVKVYVTSETMFNLIANNGSGNNYLSKNHLFIMEKGNYPWVSVNNISGFIEYWQSRINSYEFITNLENSPYNQFVASVNATKLIYYSGWVWKCPVTKSLDSNGNVIAITFTVYLKNGQIFDVKIPLLTPISPSNI